MKLREKKKKLAELFDNAKALQETNGLDFLSLFITVVQRIPRYILLLNDLIKNTPAADKEHKRLSRAIELISSIAQDINERKAAFEDLNELGRLASDIASLPIKLNEPGRRIIYSAALTCRSASADKFKEAKCWLFSDSVIVTVQTCGLMGALTRKSWKLIFFAFLKSTRVTDLQRENVISIEAKGSVLELQVDNPQLWVTKLSEAIAAVAPKLKDKQSKSVLASFSGKSFFGKK